MAKKELATIGNKSFEELKRINEHGAEYWSARELQPQTRSKDFEDALSR